ncbi:MAG: Fic family protein [Burkholderiales bacterium]|nr:Fic family protein [Burkholderiales bacterium]
MPNTPHWIWQHPDWPKFIFDMKVVAPALNRARSAQGRVLGKAEALGLANLGSALADIWVEEANATARIEGEQLDLSAVRSSVARRLGMASVGAASRSVEGLIDLMDDATRRWRDPLTVERLCGWQAALFPTGFAGMRKVRSGALRTHATPMQIVSGPVGREEVHFEAPPSRRLPNELATFLGWFQSSRDRAVDGLLRAGTAHLWFEVLHPFEDGNGRVGRAIIDLALAQDAELDQRVYSVSRRLAEHRNEYYAELNAASRADLDITRWLAWFVAQFEDACLASEAVIDLSLAKARFWLQHAQAPLSERQRKAVNRILDAGSSGFEGGMSTDKYRNLTRVSRATAYRDLEELVRHGLLVQTGVGRGTRYFAAMERWTMGSVTEDNVDESKR